MYKNELVVRSGNYWDVYLKSMTDLYKASLHDRVKNVNRFKSNKYKNYKNKF